MTFMDVIEKIKGMFGGNQELDDDGPPREIRDRHLESLEREWQYYENQKRKELLTKKLRALKKKQTKERVFGIGQNVKHPSILKAKLEDSGVDLTKQRFNLLKQKKLFR